MTLALLCCLCMHDVYTFAVYLHAVGHRAGVRGIPLWLWLAVSALIAVALLSSLLALAYPL